GRARVRLGAEARLVGVGAGGGAEEATARVLAGSDREAGGRRDRAGRAVLRGAERHAAAAGVAAGHVAGRVEAVDPRRRGAPDLPHRRHVHEGVVRLFEALLRIERAQLAPGEVALVEGLVELAAGDPQPSLGLGDAVAALGQVGAVAGRDLEEGALVEPGLADATGQVEQAEAAHRARPAVAQLEVPGPLDTGVGRSGVDRRK